MITETCNVMCYSRKYLYHSHRRFFCCNRPTPLEIPVRCQIFLARWAHRILHFVTELPHLPLVTSGGLWSPRAGTTLWSPCSSLSTSLHKHVGSLNNKGCCYSLHKNKIFSYPHVSMQSVIKMSFIGQVLGGG